MQGGRIDFETWPLRAPCCGDARSRSFAAHILLLGLESVVLEIIYRAVRAVGSYNRVLVARDVERPGVHSERDGFTSCPLASKSRHSRWATVTDRAPPLRPSAAPSKYELSCRLRM